MYTTMSIRVINISTQKRVWALSPLERVVVGLELRGDDPDEVVERSCVVLAF